MNLKAAATLGAPGVRPTVRLWGIIKGGRGPTYDKSNFGHDHRSRSIELNEGGRAGAYRLQGASQTKVKLHFQPSPDPFFLPPPALIMAPQGALSSALEGGGAHAAFSACPARDLCFLEEVPGRGNRGN